MSSCDSRNGSIFTALETHHQTVTWSAHLVVSQVQDPFIVGPQQLPLIYSYEIMLHFYKTQVTANEAGGFTENINSRSIAIKHPGSLCSSSVALGLMEAVQGHD